MTEVKLFNGSSTPECARREWYATREHAPHIDQSQHRPRMFQAAVFAQYAIGTLGAETIVDLGAGDGGMLTLMPTDVPAWGYDLQPSNVGYATKRGVTVELADIVTDPIKYGDLAICTETLEHLVNPHDFLCAVSGNSRIIVASSPWCETFNDHYEHHLWAWDVDGYNRLFRHARYQVHLHTVIGAFQVLLGVRHG